MIQHLLTVDKGCYIEAYGCKVEREDFTPIRGLDRCHDKLTGAVSLYGSSALAYLRFRSPERKGALFSSSLLKN